MSKVTLETLKADFDAIFAYHGFKPVTSKQWIEACGELGADVFLRDKPTDPVMVILRAAKLIELVESYDNETEGLQAAKLWKLSN